MLFIILEQRYLITTMVDEYQQRYLEHIERKKKMRTTDDKKIYSYDKIQDFFNILESRRSQRVFNKNEILGDEINLLLESVRVAPSSCNRQAIYIKMFDKVEDLLVGSKGWINNANKIFLLFADMKAYKSPNEIDFMPYLDAGVVIENLYLAAEVLGIGACYVNPNIRPEDKKRFDKLYNQEYNRFSGAVMFGYYDKKAIQSPKRNIKEIYDLWEKRKQVKKDTYKEEKENN